MNSIEHDMAARSRPPDAGGEVAPPVPGESGAPADETATEVLRLTGIDKRYPGVQALADISVSFSAGEVHGLVGENGAGKSTLVGVVSGAVEADGGTVELAGDAGLVEVDPTPKLMRELGVAIVYQEPALLPDLTVAENMRIGMPEHLQPTAAQQSAWAGELLEPWQKVTRIAPETYVRDLTPEQRFVVEIARALAEDPRLLILDEPTEHLLPAGVDALFASVRELVAAGKSVVFISHRIHEVKLIADRITVLRDGHLMATSDADDLTETEIVDLIVGRQLEARFPEKASEESLGGVRLVVDGLTGHGFSDVDLEVRAGEIVGLAGVEGQGQRDVIRALAGLENSNGRVAVDDRDARVSSPWSAGRAGIAYLTHDRHREGVLPGLDVRENAAAAALPRWATAGVVMPAKERSAVRSEFKDLRVKTPSLESNIETLSGGNQQKVMFSRAFLRDPKVLLADEPTQGVDVGARADLYGLLRNTAAAGTAVVVLSADAEELAGICDRVVIFSRGRAAAELRGDEVTARGIIEAAMTADTGTVRLTGEARHANPIMRLLRSDFSPGLALIPLLILVGLAGVSASEFYLTTRNFSLVLPLVSTLALFAIGQQVVLLNGAIDLSIGPLAGLQVVLASFLLTPDTSGIGLLFGIVVIALVGVAVGTVNWALVEILKVNALIATLVTFSALQGVALLFRPTPGGPISTTITDAMKHQIGWVPVSLIVVVVITLLLEYSLYRTLPGVRLRASGSQPETAKKVGVRVGRVSLAAFVLAALFATLAGFLLMAQSATGNATIGNSYTLASIGAVVLGGASVYGGRGSFAGALLGAAMIIQINTVVQFQGWSREWQLYFLGGLTIAAAGLYSRLRHV